MDKPWQALSSERLEQVFAVRAQVLVDGNGLPFVVAAGAITVP